MLVSISLTYSDINATHPVMMHWRTRRRFKKNRKRPLPNTRLKKLRRDRANIRAKIKSRLDSITFRLGDPLKHPKKRSEANLLKAKYDTLERQIAGIERAMKRASDARNKRAGKE